MFSISYSQPCDLAGTIYLSRPPYGGLGRYKDIYGQIWDVHGIFGKGGEFYVQAVPLKNLHPYYKDTSSGGGSYGVVSQTWLPYKVEVVEQ